MKTDKPNKTTTVQKLKTGKTKISKNAANTAKPKTKSKSERMRDAEQHWIVSRAKLVKILEASGMKPETSTMMITHYKKIRA